LNFGNNQLLIEKAISTAILNDCYLKPDSKSFSVEKYRKLVKPWRNALAALNYTPIGASALCALGASHYVCPRQTAEEQSAAFALISWLLDANCLDYGASLTRVRSSRDNNL